jgi:hypothetical protein
MGIDTRYRVYGLYAKPLLCVRYRVYGLYAKPLLTALRCGAPDRRRLRVYPQQGVPKGTRLYVFLEVQDDMWEPSAEFKITLVNQADASKSHSWGQ